MLRARAWQERGNSYVCAFCRSKLSTREGQLRDRPFSSTASSTPGQTLLSPRCLASRSWGTRTLSTSAVLHNSNDNGTPRPGGFLGGGLGSGGFGTFGSFGVSKATGSQTSTPGLDGLLPHEREARLRQKAVRALPPRSQPTNQDPAPEKTTSSKSHKNLKRHKRVRGTHAHGSHVEGKERKPGQKPLTSALLAEAFKTDRTPRPPPTPKSWSGDQSAESKEEPESQAEEPQRSWGAFSSRQVETEVPLPTREWAKHDSRAVDSDDASVSTRLTRETEASIIRGDEDEGSSWGLLKRVQRDHLRDSPQEKNGASKKGGEDFWNALDSRVSEFGRNRQSTHTEGADSSLTQEQPEELQPRRKSRFEEEDEVEYRRGKKDKRSKKARRQERDDDEDWDEEAVKRWEERKRRKAGKETRKLGSAPLEQETPQIFLPEFISVSNLAQALKLQPTNFLNDLEQMGFEELTGDTIMTGDTAALVAMEYGFEPTVDNGSQLDLRPQPQPEDPSTLPPRPPVVTIMGHVDHGKTTLLDWLRKSSIAAQEHGGITQHIGAFVVQMSSGKQITFLDTPGHAAFLSMRQRGANVTDIVVLVVAADDSIMPQTIEALKHATSAKVPIIVAINKVDKEDARVDQVKADLSRHGVEIEDYGGDVQVVCVSGKTGQGMGDLEESIVTLSEILDVRAEPDGMAEGWVLESSVKQTGKVATVLVKRGTLRLGDFIVAGRTWAKIRGLRNEAGVEIPEAPPGTPVEIIGWRDLPEAGEQVLQAPDEGKAKTAVEYRQEMTDREESSAQLAQQEQRRRQKAAAEEAAALLEAVGAEKAGETKPSVITQNFIIRADVAGSAEAVRGTVQEIGNHEVQPKVLRASVGAISETDVDQASVSNGIIVNFNNPIPPHIRQRANEAKVRIIDHSVIYHVADDVKAVLSDLLPHNVTYRVLGEADVLQIFSINLKKRVFKNIAGCRIRNGAIKRSSTVKLLRGGKVIYDGKIDTLKHVKKDVMEMGKGSECGIGLEGFQDLQVDDQIQTYEEIREKRSL